MRFAAIVVAGGAGLRAGGDGPKQWRQLCGKPLARWSLEAFCQACADEIVLVAPSDALETAASLCAGLSGVKVVAGGKERMNSVQAGLAALSDQTLDAVLIHDAARPFLARRHVDSVLNALGEAEGAILALPLSDTLKRATSDLTVVATPSREGLWRAQTPQAFRWPALQAAFAAWPASETPTDDAQVLERSGGRLVVVPGDSMLMKATYPEDFAIMERLAGSARMVRTGQGFDAHRFGPGDVVWLCGVPIPHNQALIGHSDADAGLHALTDALLGAIGAGDIGDHFPPTDPKWRGASSDLFLRHAAGLVTEKGGRILNVDVTLICERPKIKPYRQAMRDRLAEILNLPSDRVSVKATTTETMGFTGRQEGLAAQALATIETPA